MHLLLCRLAPGWHLLVTLGLTGLGLWAAERASRTAQTEDPQQVVIDEVVGTLLAMGLVRDRGLVAAGLALLAFRVLDITKPGIIDRVQRLKPNGLGIMADDVLAGLVAGLGTRLLSGLWLR